MLSGSSSSGFQNGEIPSLKEILKKKPEQTIVLHNIAWHLIYGVKAEKFICKCITVFSSFCYYLARFTFDLTDFSVQDLSAEVAGRSDVKKVNKLK